MFLRRLVLPLLAAVASSLFLVLPADAVPAYPPNVNGGLIVPPDIDLGEIHVLVGVGFRPGITVTVTVDRTDRNGDPNVRGFAARSDTPLAMLPGGLPSGVLTKIPAKAAPYHLTTSALACQRAASCSVQVDAQGRASFPVHFHVSHTHTITVTGVHPDGTPRVLQEVIVPETDCDEGDDHPAELGDTNLVPECDEAGGVGGSGSNGNASGVGGTGSLPNTGSNLGLPVTLGAILVAGGAGLVAVVRRRRRGAAPA
jgi:LPXTG-motif cell wall-anchored protein